MKRFSYLLLAAVLSVLAVRPAVAQPSQNDGYLLVGTDGTVYPFGDVMSYGNERPNPRAYVTDISAWGNGYVIVSSDGKVTRFANGQPQMSVSHALAGQEIATSVSVTSSGNGWWVFTNRGRVITHGDARFYGDMNAVPLNGPVIDSVITPTGLGYYMVAADGGVFAFGDAKFHGSMGGRRLNQPVVGIAPDPDLDGYWLIAADGGVFAFNAPFRNSLPGVLRGQPLNQPVIGGISYGNGYLMVGRDGGVFNFSNRLFLGSLGANPPATPIAAITVRG